MCKRQKAHLWRYKSISEVYWFDEKSKKILKISERRCELKSVNGTKQEFVSKANWSGSQRFGIKFFPQKASWSLFLLGKVNHREKRAEYNKEWNL